ncbi:hypothetical protein AB0G04_15515 [Actinoplanes sp. NPDC023801]|uniref:hypothetical protein n=1 Tax=Actinoplanes sp. NPDC023801 TaxID=3154595 RepID=UPI0033C6B42C
MSGRTLPAELAVVRALVADGLAEIGDTGDAGQVWVRTACARLTALDGVLTEATGVLAAPVQIAAVTVATFLVVAGSAAVAGALGLGGAGMPAVSAVALLILFTALPYAGRRVFAMVGLRRLARAAASPPARLPVTALPAPSPSDPRNGHEPAVPPGPGRRSEAALVRVSDGLLRARVRLVSAGLRQAGAGNWDAPRLRRAIRSDPVIRRLAHADQLLCQAVDCLERHLRDQRKDTA